MPSDIRNRFTFFFFYIQWNTMSVSCLSFDQTFWIAFSDFVSGGYNAHVITVVIGRGRTRTEINHFHDEVKVRCRLFLRHFRYKQLELVSSLIHHISFCLLDRLEENKTKEFAELYLTVGKSTAESTEITHPCRCCSTVFSVGQLSSQMEFRVGDLWQRAWPQDLVEHGFTVWPETKQKS